MAGTPGVATRLGRSVASRWELDPTCHALKVRALIGLIRDVGSVPARVPEAGSRGDRAASRA